MSDVAAAPARAELALELARSLADDATREDLMLAAPEQRASLLVTLQHLSDAVAAATLVATEVFDVRGDGQSLDGSATTPAWIRANCRTTGAEAAQRVRLARSLRHELRKPVELMTDGVITYEHLRTIDRSTRRLEPAVRADAVELLTTLAESEPVRVVRAAGQHLAQVVDPDGTLADTQQQFERRYLSMAPLMDGMTAVDGLLDAESAAVVDAALRPFLTPDGSADGRTSAQRRADGLVQLLASACDALQVPQAGGERPHLQVVVGRDGYAHLSPRREPLHPISLDRVACDAHLTPLVLDTEGTVVDLGRTRRIFSARQRKLLASRDGGCRWPGCRRPPAHADAHHVLPWQAGGATDAQNALLLCRFHHRLVHEGGWTIQVDDPKRGTHGAVHLVGPHGRRLTSLPRGP